MESPYPSPQTLEAGALSSSPTVTSGFTVSGFGVFTLVGGLVGFAGYIVAMELLEPQNQPGDVVLSHGQQEFLVSLPLCTMLGVAIGLGIAAARGQKYLVSIGLLLLTAFCGWRIVTSMWNDQIARYGRDPSEVVLYYPPLAFSVLAIVVALIVGVIAVVRMSTRVA